MAFIDKKDPVVLNIKLTSKGRETLSKGHLHFKYFAIGDSEIDYRFINETGINPFSHKILKPVDYNPDIISFVTRNFITDDELFNQEQYNEITSVPSITWNVENSVESLGFFTKNGTDYVFKYTQEYIKQPDGMVILSSVSGGNILNIYKSPTYGANVNEPAIGDYVMVRWVDYDADFNTTGYTINANKPSPHIFYKINNILGSLANDNLQITVDRELPNFIGANPSIRVGAMFFYSTVELNVDEQFSTDYASEALLSFLANCQCTTFVYPFWKLSIIHTENIAGVFDDDKQFGQFKTSIFGGFVSYIQNHTPTIMKLGVIHYSNVSPANVYGEQFLRNTPKIYIPTIMWHNSTEPKLGVTLQAIGNVKTITGVTSSLNTRYYDFADENGYVVGKVFIDLKIFVIEDPELLSAISYKSNRSWTLPDYNVGLNNSVFVGCPTCEIYFNYLVTSATTFGGMGSITITEIFNNIGRLDLNEIILQISGTSSGIVYFTPITGATTVNNLPADNYTVTLFDLGTGNCREDVFNVIIGEPEQPTPSVITTAGNVVSGGEAVPTLVNTGGNSIVRFSEVTSYGIYYKKEIDSIWSKTTLTSQLFNNFFVQPPIVIDPSFVYDYRAYIVVDNIEYLASNIEKTINVR